jgi:hypothetical protein
LANLIHNLRDEVLGGHISSQDAERLQLQIHRLRNRLRPIGISQPYVAMAVVVALMEMIAAYFGERIISGIL